MLPLSVRQNLQREEVETMLSICAMLAVGVVSTAVGTAIGTIIGLYIYDRRQKK